MPVWIRYKGKGKGILNYNNKTEKIKQWKQVKV